MHPRSFATLALLVIAVLLAISLLNHQPSQSNQDYLRKRAITVADELQEASASATSYHAESADNGLYISADNFGSISEDGNADNHPSADEDVADEVQTDSSESEGDNKGRYNARIDETLVEEVGADQYVNESSVEGEVQANTSAVSVLREGATVSNDAGSQEAKDDNDGFPREVMIPIRTDTEGQGGQILSIRPPNGSPGVDQTIVQTHTAEIPRESMNPITTGNMGGGRTHTITQPVESPGVGQSATQAHSVSNDPSSKDSGSLKEAGSLRKVTLREKLLKRSLETKQLISKKLQEVVAMPKNSRYRNYQHSRPRAESGNISCDREDAFAGIPVDGGAGTGAWVPPGGFPTDSIQKWDREYKAAMRRIKEISVGGTELRELAKVEVEHLRQLRHSLFCGDDF